MNDRIRKQLEDAIRTSGEEGHAYAWGGGGIVTILLIVLLLILIF